MSTVSRTTIGGAEFELLCTGAVRNYSANPANIAGQTEVKAIKKKLIAQLEDTVRELELHSDRTIAKIYIGKTYIKRRRKARGHQKFHPLKHHTWKKNGIGSRWQDHKKQEYGRDGLVVLGAITRETMPEKCRDRVHQEDFALAMEQKLLHHYLLSHPDPRVINESFSTGQATKEKYYAYAVYMAFRYKGEASSSTMCQYSEPGPSHTPPPSSPTITPPPRKKGASTQQKQPTPNSSAPHTTPSLAVRSDVQQATGRGPSVQQATGRVPSVQLSSPTINQDTAPGTPTRGKAGSSPATRLYPQKQPLTTGATTPSSKKHPQTRGATPTKTKPKETPPQQSSRSSKRRGVTFDETQMPKRQRRATRQRSVHIDLTEDSQTDSII